MKMKNTKQKILSFFLVIVLIFSITATLSSCSDIYGGTKEIYTKSELLSNIESEDDKELMHASDYFDKWDFPRFSASKLELAERVYEKNFVDEMPSAYEMASKAGKIFVELYYDMTELSDAEKVTDALINSYTISTGDKYSLYRTRTEYESYYDNMSGSFVGIGVGVLYNRETKIMRVETLTEGAGAIEAGIAVGDVIVSVDGREVSEIGYEAAVEAIRGKADTVVKIGVLRGEQRLEFSVTRKIVLEKTVEYTINDGIAYIKITGFKTNTTQQFKDAVDAAVASGAVGVIYDLRDNPGGYLSSVCEMLDYLVPKGTPIASFSKNYREEMKAEDSHFICLPTVVVCNSDTASAAELFTAAIRDYSKMKLFDALIVGSVSYGKGIMQDTYRFSDGSSLTLTVAYYNTPLGDNYHGEGIVPDKIFDTGNEDSWISLAKSELLNLIDSTKKQ